MTRHRFIHGLFGVGLMILVAEIVLLFFLVRWIMVFLVVVLALMALVACFMLAVDLLDHDR